MTRYTWTMAVTLALAACSDSHDHTPGSQTHFLQACDGSCAAPYDCICGVCTLTCSKDAQCSEHASEAQCTAAQSSSDAQCNPDTPVCDIGCDADRDCRSLGDAFACSGGRCREVPMSMDTGAHDSGTETNTGTDTGTGNSGTPLDAAVIVLDSGTQSSDAATTTGGDGTAICDGSDDIRLGMWMGGGFVGPEWQFLHPFGEYFAFVDGHCNYHASWDAMLGVRAGTLSAAQAETLALEIGWSDIDAFSAHVDAACPDAPSSMISNGTHAFGCSCGCDEDAPPGLAGAEAAARMWIERLATDQGQPLRGPLRVVATELTSGMPAGLQSWPLANRPISDVVVPQDQLNGSTEGVEFTEQADVDALRAMRGMAQMAAPGTQQIFVGDGDKRYLMYMRDELPSEVDATAHAFETASYASH